MTLHKATSCFSQSRIIKRWRESEVSQQAAEQPRILLLSFLTKVTEIHAVSIKTAHLVLKHQVKLVQGWAPSL